MFFTKFAVTHAWYQSGDGSRKKCHCKKISIIMKATTTKVALEVAVHVARAVVLVQVELRRRKIANAQLGFFESSSKLL
jgi:hypothetical protein